MGEAKAAEDEYNKAKKDVEDAIQKEQAAASAFREAKAKRQQELTRVETLRRDLMEAQKKVALLEIHAMNARKMQELEARRKAAADAAEQAKKFLAEQRQKEKEALEATRKALEEARALKGGGKGRAAAKRASEDATNGATSPKKP